MKKTFEDIFITTCGWVGLAIGVTLGAILALMGFRLNVGQQERNNSRER